MKARKIRLSADSLYVWAGVYRGPRRDIATIETVAFDRAQLLVLHAATRTGDEPEIVAVSGHRATAL